MQLRLTRLIRQNLRRNLRHNLLASIGIIVGIAAFSFFLALDAGVRRVVLGDIFPVEQLEIISPRATLLGTGRPLDEEVVERLRDPPPEIPHPEAVYPRMKLGFPARAWGGKHLLGRKRDLYFELTGFCDGVEAGIVEADVRPPLTFEDWLAGIGKPRACGPEGACPEGLYCAWDVNQCHKPVPALVSRHVIELYNGSIAANNPSLPRIPDFVSSVFAGKLFTVELGRSYLGVVPKRDVPPIQRRFQLVGVSDMAMRLGITVPLGYVKRWNAHFGREGKRPHFSSALVVMESKADITPYTAYVKSLGYRLADGPGEKVGLFITLATLLLAVISSVIVLIAAVNIAHTFFMMVAERRHEIGMLRAIGATKHHLRLVILGEASALGIFSGALGVLLAYLISLGIDGYSASYLPDFPYKPGTYFCFSPMLIVAAIGFAVLFCLIGAGAPAQRAASLRPADALRRR